MISANFGVVKKEFYIGCNKDQEKQFITNKFPKRNGIELCNPNDRPILYFDVYFKLKVN